MSCIFIRHYTENFTSDNPLHKIVHILLAVLWLGHIAGSVKVLFMMCNFVALCPIFTWHTAFPVPVLVLNLELHCNIPYHLATLSLAVLSCIIASDTGNILKYTLT